MSERETFHAEVQTTVGSTGVIDVYGRTYWAPKLSHYVGWTVRVRVPEDENAAVQVWRGTQYLVSADRIANVGFVDMSAARKASLQSVQVSRRVRAARQSLIVRRRAELLVQLLDQTVENRSFFKFASSNVLSVNALERFRSLFLKIRKVVFDDDLRGDSKRSEHANARLQLAERIFELSDAIFKDHPDLPSLGAMTEAATHQVVEENDKRPGEAGHRLSETAE